jgi:HSP20 family protein
MTSDPHDWMWSEALSMLARAERMHQQMFMPAGPSRQAAAWEPPVDVLETEREVLVLAALPGVDVAKVEAAIDGACLVIAGQRVLPPELHSAVIHRLELPQGRFERRVPLPPGHYDGVRRAEAHGCLVISLSKLKP